MKRIALLLGLLTFALTINAQNFGEIHGKVVGTNNEGIPNANVWVETLNGQVLTSSDLDGTFVLKPLPPATYVVYISFTGYHTDTVTNVVVQPNKILPFGTRTLYDAATDISKEAVVKAFRIPLIEPETGVTTKSYEEIKSSPLAKTPMKYITTMNSAITQGADGELYFRGSRSGAIQYHIDGVKMTTNVTNVPSASIGSIQVYTGGVPAKYGDTTGGVVVIETRSFMDLYLKKKYSS